MGAVGVSSSVSGLLDKSMANYDHRFSEDIQSAAEEIHKEFPKVAEIARIKAGSTDGAANMDGLGTLSIDDAILQDYNDGRVKNMPFGWSAGDGTFKNSVVAHELAHNLDRQFTSMLSDYAPQITDKPITIPNELWAEAYGKALGRKLKVGDVVSDIPSYDTSAKIMTIDGKQYSVDDIYNKGGKKGGTTVGNLSDLIVPMAIENVKSNWKALGYKSEPTTSQLINNLSGYVNTYYSEGDGPFNAEVFAESYSGHKSYGKDANPLAQEVMRLTKQAYKSATAHKRNGVMDFYKKLFKAQDEVKKKHGIGDA